MQGLQHSSFASVPIVRSRVNHRDRNEDSFLFQRLIIGDGAQCVLLLALADGMGGYAHGDEISQEALRKACLTLFRMLCVDRALNALQCSAFASIADLGEILVSTLGQTCEHVRRMVHNNSWGKAGSTIVMGAILDDTCLVVNLGDSPMFHFESSTGQLTQITDDHTVTGVLLRAGRISPTLARYHAGRSVLEFYLGAERMPREDPLHQVKLAGDDVLLLCSDGVTGQLPHDTIRQCLAESGADLDQAADALMSASADAGETDNQTLILWRYSKPTVAAESAASTLVLSRHDAPSLTSGSASHPIDTAIHSYANPSETAVLSEAPPARASDTLVLQRTADDAPAPDAKSNVEVAPPADVLSDQTDLAATQPGPAKQPIVPQRIEHAETTPKNSVSEEVSQ